MNYYAKTDYLKIKVDSKWFVIDSFRIVDKPQLGGRCIIGTEAFKRNSIIIVSVKAKCKIVKYNKYYDQFITFFERTIPCQRKQKN